MGEFDTKIKVLKNELSSLESRMETLFKKFCEEVAEFLTSWYEAQARDEVKRKSDVTIKIGKDQLAVLKQKISDLQKKVKDVVSDFLGKDSIWWHKSHGKQQYSYHGNRPPDIVEKALRLAAGLLAPILEDFGYFSKDGPEPLLWREWDSTGKYQLQSGRPYYPYGLEWSPQMKNFMREYDEAHIRCQEILAEISRLEKEKREKQSEDLWDSL
jgi:hypothetical protein